MAEWRRSLPLTATSVAVLGGGERLARGQLVTMQLLLRGFGVVEVHHDDRLGAAEDIHRLADRLRAWRMVHPLERAPERAGFQDDVVYTERPAPQHHREMVDAAGLLVVALDPITSATDGDIQPIDAIRYALAKGKPVVVVDEKGSQRWLGTG